jgi:cation:H+ antiporter
MIISLTLILLYAILIGFIAHIFTNAIECLGEKLSFKQHQTGGILAAIGTSLPETLITLVAAISGYSQSPTSHQSQTIAVGAALSGPLVLGSMAYGVIGLSLIFLKKKSLLSSIVTPTDNRSFGHIQNILLALFIPVIILGQLTFPYKNLFGLVLIALYVFYVYSQLSSKGESEDEAEKTESLLFYKKNEPPSYTRIIFQVLIASLLMYLTCEHFIKELLSLATVLGFSPLIVSLYFCPIATELPEIVAAIQWSLRGKTVLALHNISGSMIVQTTLPCGFALLLTDWQFDKQLTFVSVIIAFGIVQLALGFYFKKVTPLFLSTLISLYAVFIVLSLA